MTGESIRSVFVQWPLLLRDGDRLLADLRELTDVNTIELSHIFVDWGDLAGAGDVAPLALPPTDAFGELSVPAVSQETFGEIVAAAGLARAHGFRVLVNVSPLFFGFAAPASFGMVDVTGEPPPGLRPDLRVYGCPSNEAVSHYGEVMVREFAAAWPVLDGITLNHLEYPFWPRRGLRELLSCFCDACRARASEDGVDLDETRQAVARLHETMLRGEMPRVTPGLRQWLSFRLSTMTAYARRLVAAARDADRTLGLGLEFQAPAVSTFVGTDFVALEHAFDWLTPKFPDYLASAVVPIIADEIAAASGRDVAALRQDLRALLELGHGPGHYEPIHAPQEHILYANAFDEAMIDLQVSRLAPLRATLYPYIWLYGSDVDLLAVKRRALKRHGFDGFFLWCWDEDLTTESLRRLAATAR